MIINLSRSLTCWYIITLLHLRSTFITPYSTLTNQRIFNPIIRSHFLLSEHSHHNNRPTITRYSNSKRRNISTCLSKTEQFGNRDETWQKRSKKWVVFVDDEEPIRKAVGQYLFDQGYQVTACADADTALKVCRSKDNDGLNTIPDIIVSDVRMPGKDGLELLEIMRSDEELVGVPVVLLTAKGMAEDRIAGYKAGADAYIPKPFDPEELLMIIDNAIDRHETLNGNKVKVEDLKRDLDEIKYLLIEKGGAGVGNGWIKATNVFLTPDEKNVLELLCKGYRNREIAEKTFLSQRRVEQHLTSMYRKVDVSNRTELVRWAVATGIVDV